VYKNGIIFVTLRRISTKIIVAKDGSRTFLATILYTKYRRRQKCTLFRFLATFMARPTLANRVHNSSLDETSVHKRTSSRCTRQHSLPTKPCTYIGPMYCIIRFAKCLQRPAGTRTRPKSTYCRMSLVQVRAEVLQDFNLVRVYNRVYNKVLVLGGTQRVMSPA